jgi:quercetin dioxygenase-like cupin family protein
VKRHDALVPLSHDHHHALVEARRLRRAADGPDASRAAAAFLRFFRAETTRHFREEEEHLFPLAVGHAEAREPIVQALLEHQRLRALAGELEARLTGEGQPGEVMRELGELLEAHVRHEERVLFPLLERLLGDAGLASLGPAATAARGGPVWGSESEDLNATLLAWPAGGGPAEHVNAERDVLVFVVDGSATVALDGREHDLGPGEALIVEKGRSRRVIAGPAGVRYLSVHLRRPGIQIASRAG